MDRYAVLGNPIAHSKSPAIHTAFAAQTAQPLSYERIEVPLDAFAARVGELIRAGFRGFNVTVPFKEQAFTLAQHCTPRARAAGAVNTLMATADGLLGDNTDGAGLVADLRRLGAPLAGARVLLLGAGGASRGVILPLRDAGVAELAICNRTADKALTLASEFGTAVQEPASADTPYDVVINATSAGLAGALPPLPAGAVAAHSFAYDMLYGAQPTAFMQHCAALGARTADGLGMLVGQAAESFALWRGVRPDAAPVLEQLRAAMKA
ncbi:shikimate dehydrogenase [beta proteobacterium AAP99]|nr:shikimate dehydrogenase [beta proteobacterium AAP99]